MRRRDCEPGYADAHRLVTRGAPASRGARATALSFSGIAANVLESVARAPSIFCFLDYDGVLAPLAPTPAQATPPPGTALRLRHLATIAPDTQVAIVTGRPIADVRRFVDLPELYYVGMHGLEVMLPHEPTPTVQGVGILRTIFPTMKRDIERRVGGRHGVFLEDKGAALACHYRQASDADAEVARQTMADLTHRYRRRGISMRLQYGHAVAEIHPAYVNKGKAVCALLAARAPDALPIYIGNDGTDVDAFRLLPRRAITIHVAPREPTLARFTLAATADVHRFLNLLLRVRVRTAAQRHRPLQ